MIVLTNYYGYKRLNDFSSQGSVFDHRGALVQQKTDLPIIVINWLNGQMLARETDALPLDEINKVQSELNTLVQGEAEELPTEAEELPKKARKVSGRRRSQHGLN